MTTFIPFGSPNGNPKFIQTGVFSEGQEIKVKATGILAGATGSPMIKESAAVAIQAASAWASVPLNSSTTTYGMHMGDYVTNNTPNYQPMAWITFQGDDFTNAGLNAPDSGNNINTSAAALVYENMMFNVAMSRLSAQQVSPSSATPICFDPEDLGVDKALFYHDIYSAWVDEGQPAGSTSFASDLHPYDQDGVAGLSFPGTDITTSAPLIIQMFKNLKERINAIYPNSPVGFYSVGSAAFWVTGWSGVYKNNTNTNSQLYKSYEIMERMFDGNLSETGSWWGYQTMDVLDFVFNSYYPSLADTSKLPFVRYGAQLEVLKNFLNLFIDKFAGTSQGAKMMVGVSVEASVPSGDLSSQEVIYSDIAKNDTTLTVAGEPVDWYNSTLLYPDFNSVPKITNSSLNADFVSTPIAMQGDLIKWLNLLPTDASPAGFQSAPAAASPVGAEAALSQLSGSLRDFPMAIWDGAYTATGFYQGVDNDLYGPTLTDAQVKKFRGVYTKHTIMDAYTNSGQTTNPYGSWLAAQMDADAATYITMFSTKGAQDWYSSSAAPNPLTVGSEPSYVGGSSDYIKLNSSAIGTWNITGTDTCEFGKLSGNAGEVILQPSTNLVRMESPTGGVTAGDWWLENAPAPYDKTFRIKFILKTDDQAAQDARSWQELTYASYNAGATRHEFTLDDLGSNTTVEALCIANNWPQLDTSVAGHAAGSSCNWLIEVIEAPSSADMGSMSFTYTGTNQTSAVTYTEATDPSGVTGVFMAQGRYGASTFDGQVIIGNTIKIGPGYSDSGSVLVDGGIYSTPTYAYTGNDVTKTGEWVSALAPSGISFTVTVDRSGTIFQSTKIIGDFTNDNQGGYVNLQLGSLGNFVSSYQVGDIVTIQCTKL